MGQKISLRLRGPALRLGITCGWEDGCVFPHSSEGMLPSEPQGTVEYKLSICYNKKPLMEKSSRAVR